MLKNIFAKKNDQHITNTVATGTAVHDFDERRRSRVYIDE